MLYFSNFPTKLFLLSPAAFGKPAEYVTVTDITRNFRFKREVLDKINLYEFVNIGEGDTIENFSERVYGTPHYYWVLMLLNEKFDYLNDLPILSSAIETKLNYNYIKLPRKELKRLKDSGTNFVDSFEIGTVTSDYDYLDERYGESVDTMLVEFRNDKGRSIDLDQVVNLRNKINNTVSQHHVFSLQVYDPVIKKRVKRLRFKNTGEEVDTKIYKLDLASIPNVFAVSISQMETIINDQKRTIKIISPSIMTRVLQNFRDLL